MRRAAGVRWAPLKSFLVDAVPSIFTVLLVGLVVYVLSWMAFLTHAQKFEDAFGHAASKDDWTWSSVDDHPHNAVEGVVHDLDILWNYHKELYMFHTGAYLSSQYHPWESNPGGWLVLNRPIPFAVQTTAAIPNCPPGQQCVKEVLALGNPILWWGGVVALFVSLGYWLSRRDWRFGIPIVGVLTTWLPWFKFDNRQIFFYYGVSIIPFTIIAITLVLGKLLGRAGAPYGRRVAGGLLVASFVVTAAAFFAYFYPILSDHVLSLDAWHSRIWLTYWNKAVPAPGATSSSP
jgi:dolichyl-phosphate-mannose--protein O-mannosyl transferase